ncbi:hypothetical protein POM88_046087 [Heracleum sosnowskyi]|uniref:Uncharacterized protein n=1 Tax=Heracleum sosnowskyi TaxID=360622 RepID=A0AAD8H7R1_9APIA|nr:hypothetical protein POM88_046087 [Heracleum sosnowskyi]
MISVAYQIFQETQIRCWDNYDYYFPDKCDIQVPCSRHQLPKLQTFSGKNYCHGEYSYVVVGFLSLSDVVDGCKTSEAAWISSDWQSRFIKKSNITIINKADNEDIVSEVMAYGFDLPWDSIFCSISCEPESKFDFNHEYGAFRCQPYSEPLSLHKGIGKALQNIVWNFLDELRHMLNFTRTNIEEKIEDCEPEIEAEDQEPATPESTDLSDEITTSC